MALPDAYHAYFPFVAYQYDSSAYRLYLPIVFNESVASTGRVNGIEPAPGPASDGPLPISPVATPERSTRPERARKKRLDRET